MASSVKSLSTGLDLTIELASTVTALFGGFYVSRRVAITPGFVHSAEPGIAVALIGLIAGLIVAAGNLAFLFTVGDLITRRRKPLRRVWLYPTAGFFVLFPFLVSLARASLPVPTRVHLPPDAPRAVDLGGGYLSTFFLVSTLGSAAALIFCSGRLQGGEAQLSEMLLTVPGSRSGEDVGVATENQSGA